MPRATQLWCQEPHLTQVRSDNFTWHLQTYFILPLLLHREGCASHTVPAFPTSTRGNVMPSFSLTVSPGKAAATGQHHTLVPWLGTGCPSTQLTAEPLGKVHTLHCWSKHRNSSCRPPTLGEPTAMGSNRVPVHCTLNTEHFQYTKNDHSKCVWGAQGVYSRPGLALL